ncbi:MAG: DegT/DnrJ/EryC1/StrS family aminotransferase [Planctomycetes bacterium]|nr:DegT/DnrJ/EryC1/StrS family aminotransferase [Planctomycetota bacterium]
MSTTIGRDAPRRDKSSFPPLPPLGGWYTEEEVEAVTRALRESMDWRVGFGGKEIAEFEAAFARYCDVKHALALNSCGTGLDIAMMCLDLKPGDEVISPAITFKATHLAILGQGAKLVLCETDPRTFNLDPADVERRMTPRTRAILAVHNNGLSAFMDDLQAVAERHPHPQHGPAKVIGDAARAVGATYKGTRVGKMGWMNIFSFQTTKNMTTLGEGGLITTDDPEVARRTQAYRSFGGGTDLWGTNYRMTKLQAAAGIVQLRRLDEMNARRVDRARRLTARLQAIPELTTPWEPPNCGHIYYGYTLLVPADWAGPRRDKLCAILKDESGVGTVVMNDVTPTQHPLIKRHVEGQHTPVSDLTGKRLFCVSLHPLMTDDDLDYIAQSLAEAVGRVRRAE